MKRLTTTLFFFLLAYHAFNYAYPQKKLWFVATRSLDFHLFGTRVLSLPTLLNFTDTESPIDSASSALTYFSRLLNPWEIGKKNPSSIIKNEKVDIRITSQASEKLTSYLVDLSKRIEACGSTLIVLPIPAKEGIVRRPERASETQMFYKDFIQRTSPYTLPLYDTFLEQQHKAHDSLYDSDMHWSNFGIVVTSSAVMDRLSQQFKVDEKSRIISKGNSRYDLAPVAQKTFERVLGFGTSFSENYKELGLNLASVLSRALGAKEINLGSPASGFSGSIRRISEFRISSKDLILWEFPVQHLVLDNNFPAIAVICENSIEPFKLYSGKESQPTNPQ